MPPIPDFIQRSNAGYIEEQHERFLRDPSSVPPDWAAFFSSADLAAIEAAPGAAEEEPFGRSGGIFGLVQHYRVQGHLGAHLDPLGAEPEGSPLLDPAQLGFREADLARPIAEAPLAGGFRGTVRDLIETLRATYCGSIGVEYMGIADAGRREWLQERMEPCRNRPALEPEDRRRILRQLVTADGFEEFLQVRFPGQKRFSLEGASTLIPMLDALVEEAARLGVVQLVIGMPHRGRLNVLANLMQKPYEAIFSEFEAGFLPEDVQGEGDVKYHLGYSCDRRTRAGGDVHLDLNFNPSHLEFVNPVVLGAVRARQDVAGDAARARCVAVLIHGDAAFAGEGIVPETLALAALPHYETGGTIHIVVNNQVGFTTSPAEARTSRYATDVARVENDPVFHVNADDPEAVVHVIRLAVAYRMRFKRDVFVDLVCYRKHGHNELDDPAFTQPVMVRAIARHPTISTLYASRLAGAGVIAEDGLTAMRAEVTSAFQAAHGRVRARPEPARAVPLGGAWVGLEWAGGAEWDVPTAVSRGALERVTAALAALPEGFHPHRKVVQLAEDRRRMFEENRVDWGLGEALAIGSLLLEGRNVRLSGQDTARGTFSHRHAVLHDQENGARWVPLRHLEAGQGRFDVFDTPLAEGAPLGFEYGYSTADPHTLVVWEAQFGDFANVAQVYLDQFIASAESKWRRMSGLTLLLPHGYEGQGPEHSSARLERCLELCAKGNLQVCNPTTPAQLFHALRRQLLRKFRKPLVIMSPKSLLRHKLAISAVDEFTTGGFRPVIDDAASLDPATVRTVLLVSGRFYVALEEARAATGARDVARVRIEQLYPFPAEALRHVLGRYPEARALRWVQEEPANMGAWRNTRHRIEAARPATTSLRLVARKAAPSPATGYYVKHVAEERDLIERALAPPGEERPAPRGPAAPGAPRAAGPVRHAGSGGCA